jgi:hypothetical protein
MDTVRDITQQVYGSTLQIDSKNTKSIPRVLLALDPAKSLFLNSYLSKFYPITSINPKDGFGDEL